jgi:hypothetical protein
MDAKYRKTCDVMRTAKACGPGALVAGAKVAGRRPASDGDTKASLTGARTIYAVKTIAQGMSMFGFICGD